MIAREILGIAIEPSAIHVVCLRGDELAWTLDGEVEAEGSVGDALASLLARAPAHTRTVRRAVIAMGPSFVQLRRLDGFPATENDAVRDRILAEGVRRWFLLRAGGLVTAGPVTANDGALWGAAFERSAVDGIRSAATSAGVVVTQFVPAAALLSLEPVEWLHTSNEAAGASARAQAPGAERIAAAHAAAGLGVRREIAPFALGAGSTTADAIPRSRARAALAGAGLAVTAFMLAYPVSIWHTGARLRRETSSVGARLEAGAERTDALARTTDALEAIARRRASRISWITPISELAGALPPGTAAVTLRADSSAGVVVVLGPRAGAVIDQFDGLTSIVSPSLVGPVTSEVVGGQLMERATIGFTVGAAVGARLRERP